MASVKAERRSVVAARGCCGDDVVELARHSCFFWASDILLVLPSAQWCLSCLTPSRSWSYFACAAAACRIFLASLVIVKGRSSTPGALSGL